MKNDERICWNCGSRILKFYQNHHITMACSPNEGYMKVVSVHQFTVLKQCEPICLGTRLVPSRQISGRPATRVNGWSRLIHRSLGFCQIFRETKWNERDPPLNKDNWPIDQLGSRFVKSSHWSRKPSSLIHCRAGELPALPGLVVATSATGIYWISRKICWNPKHVGDQDARLQEKNSEIWKQKNHSSFPEQFLNCVPSVSYKGFPSGAIERKNVFPDVCPDCDVSAIALQWDPLGRSRIAGCTSVKFTEATFHQSIILVGSKLPEWIVILLNVSVYIYIYV
jgi:hypothetical protein